MDTDLVIFDKDGTLIDVHYYWGGMVELRAKMLSKKYIKSQYQEKATYELMFNMGISLETMKIKPMGPVGIKPREYIINTAYQVVKQYFDAITIEQVSSVFKEIDVNSQTHLAQLVKPLPGVEELLATLKQQKIKIKDNFLPLTFNGITIKLLIKLNFNFTCFFLGFINLKLSCASILEENVNTIANKNVKIILKKNILSINLKIQIKNLFPSIFRKFLTF